MEDKIACKGLCKRQWPRYGKSSLLRHISQARNCKAKYSEDEISSFKTSSYLRKKEQGRIKNKDVYDPNARKQKHQRAYNAKKEKRGTGFMTRKRESAISDMNVSMDQFLYASVA